MKRVILLPLFLVLASCVQPYKKTQQIVEAEYLNPYQWITSSPIRTQTTSSHGNDWTFTVWRNETTGQYISLKDTHNLAPSDFRVTFHEKPEDSDILPVISLSRLGYVRADKSMAECDNREEEREFVQIADALLPTHTGRSNLFWITVSTTKSVKPGQYSGTINLGTADAITTPLNFSFEVLEWVLPSVDERKFHLDIWQFPTRGLERYNEANPDNQISLWSDHHFEMLEPIYRYLAGLGQRSVTTYIKDGALGAPSMVTWAKNSETGTWEFDYSIFDRYVETLQNWGINSQINAFSIVGSNPSEITYLDTQTDEMKTLEYELGSKEFNAIWTEFLSSFRTHLKQKGWFEKTVLYMDEVRDEEMSAIVDLIKGHDSDWKIGLAYGHAPSEHVANSLYDISGIFETEMQVKTDPEQLNTFYTSCTQLRPNNYVSSDGNPADLVALPWHAANREHKGYLRWAFDNWHRSDPFDLEDGAFTSGDYSFVYRSSNNEDMTVVPSIRSELLRDGVEDFEKIKILENYFQNCGFEPGSAGIQNIVVPFSVENLKAGRSSEIVQAGKIKLANLSSEFDPEICPGR